jgi:ParB family chromosome partitioning protein
MITEVPINKITPDPEQPRKSKLTKDIEELAENMKEHGVINPIEIDEHNIIITGELRYLACKKLGLKTVPCRIVKGLAPEKRFLRQLSENVHQHVMLPIEEAKAFRKAIASHFKGGRALQDDEGIRWLASQIGKSRNLIAERLSLLEQSKEFQKAIKENKISATAVRSIVRAPAKFQKAMEKKILAGKAGTAMASIHIARRLKDRPDAAKEILKENFAGMGEIEVSKRLHQIAPTPAENQWKDFDYFKNTHAEARRLYDLLLYKNPFQDGKIHYDGMEATGTAQVLEGLLEVIPRWLKAYREIEIKGCVEVINDVNTALNRK